MSKFTTFFFVVAWCVAGVAHGQDKPNGRKLLEEIFSDRPELQGIFPDDDVVVRWVVRRLETGRSGDGIRWDDTEPINGLADHAYAYAGKPAVVRVTGRSDVSGRDKWYMLVFELFNEFHPTEVEAFEKLAASGKVNRVQFAKSVLDHEYQRMRIANKFFRRYPILGATPQNAPLYTQYMGIFDATQASHPEDQIQEIPQPNSNFAGHYEHYGQWFDTVRFYGPRRVEQGRTPKQSFSSFLKTTLSGRAR